MGISRFAAQQPIWLTFGELENIFALRESLRCILHLPIGIGLLGLRLPVGSFCSFEGSSVSCDQVLPQIPLVLHHLIAHSASYALGLDVDIDDVLFQVEAVRESLPAVLANSGLHTPPPVSWMCRLRSVRRCRLCV